MGPHGSPAGRGRGLDGRARPARVSGATALPVGPGAARDEPRGHDQSLAEPARRAGEPRRREPARGGPGAAGDRWDAEVPVRPARWGGDRERPDPGRGPVDRVHLDPGGVSAGLPVLSDRADGDAAQPDRGRDRGGGAPAAGPARGGRADLESRPDGDGGAVAELPPGRAGAADPLRSARRQFLAATDHALDGRARSRHQEAGGIGPRCEPRRVAERHHRCGARPAHAHQQTLADRRPAGGLPGLPLAAIGGASPSSTSCWTA